MKCCSVDQVHAESATVTRRLLEGYQVTFYHLAFMNNEGHIKLAVLKMEFGIPSFQMCSLVCQVLFFMYNNTTNQPLMSLPCLPDLVGSL